MAGNVGNMFAIVAHFLSSFFFFAVPTGHLKPLYREKATAEFDEHEV